MSEDEVKDLVMLALKASLEAGKKILDIYHNTFSIDYKTDGSPLTDADRASHDTIEKLLHQSKLPVLSEEGKDIPY